jgi:hypothetical protein
VTPYLKKKKKPITKKGWRSGSKCRTSVQVAVPQKKQTNSNNKEMWPTKARRLPFVGIIVNKRFLK